MLSLTTTSGLTSCASNVLALQDAARPYDDMSSDVVLTRVKAGYRLSCPDGCPEDVYNSFIVSCWAARPEDRPQFAALAAQLADVAGTRQGLARAAAMGKQAASAAASPIASATRSLPVWSEPSEILHQPPPSPYLDLKGSGGHIIEAAVTIDAASIPLMPMSVLQAATPLKGMNLEKTAETSIRAGWQDANDYVQLDGQLEC